MSAILLQVLPHIAAALLYAVLGVHFWHTRWRESNHGLITRPMQPWERLSIFFALTVQGLGLYQGLFGAGGMRFSFSFALSLMLWLAVLIYWLESFRSRMDGLQPMVLPIAALCALAPAIFPQLREVAHAGAWGFQLHFLTAMLAYSLFTLSALHAVFMSFAERNPKKPRREQMNKKVLAAMVSTLAFGTVTVAKAEDKAPAAEKAPKAKKGDKAGAEHSCKGDKAGGAKSCKGDKAGGEHSCKGDKAGGAKSCGAKSCGGK